MPSSANWSSRSPGRRFGTPSPSLSGWARTRQSIRDPRARFVPASALVVGDNVLTLGVASGSSGVGFLSPGFAYDAIDFVRAP